MAALKNKKLLLILLVSLASIPVITHFFLLWRYSYNMPYQDDYDAILNAITLRNILPILSQQNEHRIAYTRLISLLQFDVSGSINFIALMFVGSLSLLPISLFFLKILKYNWLSFLPLSYFIFDPSSYENTYMAMTALQNFTVIAFSLTVFYFLAKETRSGTIIAIAFGVAASFTSGNGMFVFLVGTVMLLSQKRYFEMLWFIIIGVIVAWIYFSGYHHPAQIPDAITTLKHPLAVINFFFYFLGAFLLSNFIPSGVSLVTGIIIFAIYLYLTYKKFYKTNALLFFTLTFFLVTVGLASIARAGLGDLTAFSSRYHIISFILLALTYVSLLTLQKNGSRFAIITTILAITLWFRTTQLYLPVIKDRNRIMRESTAQYKKNKTGLQYPNQEVASKILETSLKSGIFKLP